MPQPEAAPPLPEPQPEAISRAAFKVRVIVDELNVRRGPGTISQITRTLKHGDIVGVVDILMDAGLQGIWLRLDTRECIAYWYNNLKMAEVIQV
jgi:hypothetical protein